MNCETYEHSIHDLEPASVGSKTPGASTFRIRGDYGKIDCENIGITISTSVWSIDPTNDDGQLTLGVDSINGLKTDVPVSGGTDGALYDLRNVVTFSDGQQIDAYYRIPVCEKRLALT